MYYIIHDLREEQQSKKTKPTGGYGIKKKSRVYKICTRDREAI